MQKHFFFDLDNTLTRSRSHIDPSHAPILAKLADRADVIVVTGSHRNQTDSQLKPELEGKYFVLAQNGNQAVHRDGTVLWERMPSPEQKAAIVALAQKMVAHLALEVKDPNDLIEDRGSSVSYSTLGHHEDIAKKEPYDPDHSKRRALLEHFKTDVDALRTQHNIEVRTGGTTCLDFFEAGKNKGYNIDEFLKIMQWQKDDCLYIGDALFPGGNDETVIGVIPTQLVKDYHATYEYLKGVLQ
jgi:phosphomannomutase